MKAIPWDLSDDRGRSLDGGTVVAESDSEGLRTILGRPRGDLRADRWYRVRVGGSTASAAGDEFARTGAALGSPQDVAADVAAAESRANRAEAERALRDLLKAKSLERERAARKVATRETPRYDQDGLPLDRPRLVFDPDILRAPGVPPWNPWVDQEARRNAERRERVLRTGIRALIQGSASRGGVRVPIMPRFDLLVHDPSVMPLAEDVDFRLTPDGMVEVRWPAIDGLPARTERATIADAVDALHRSERLASEPSP